ncbi:hypothetical protein [Arthrobacter sp. MDT1-65]
MLSVVGILDTIGCGLALYLESNGLDAPRDVLMGPGYTALFINGVGVAILVLAVSWFAVLPSSRWLIVLVTTLATAIIVLVTLAIKGITARSTGYATSAIIIREP